MARLARIVAASAVFAAPALAQQSFDLPTLRFNPSNNNFPFGGPPMRYQQWFAASEWKLSSSKPIRVIAMQFLTGPGGQGVGRTIDVEVRMAHALPTTVSGSFDQNLVRDNTLVFPRGSLTLQSPGSSATPVQISFQTEFVWDGESGVIVDIKLYDNGNNGQPYTYDMEYNAFTQHRSTRLYTTGNPNATTAATVSTGTGLTVRFLYDEALPWPYGQGCAGDGGFVPVHGTDGGFPIPGNTSYGMTLTGAPSQRSALFFIGGSDTQWGSLTLPYELVLLGANGCFVLADPIASATVTTVGGGPGSGIARFPFPMPPTTGYVGTSFYSQWLVLDPNAPNGLLCVSNGIRHITAMR